MSYLSANKRAAMLHFYGTDNPADLVTIDDGGGYVRVMHKDKAAELGLMGRVIRDGMAFYEVGKDESNGL